MSTPAVTPEVTSASTTQEIKAAWEAQSQQPASTATEPTPVPAAPPEPTPAVQKEWGAVEKTGDGQYQVKLASGEVFQGTADEVIAKQAEAHVNTKRWGQEWKQKAETAPPPQAPAPALSAEQQSELATQQWAAEQVAKFLGLENADQLKAAMSQMQATTQQASVNNSWVEFTASCPDYVDDVTHADALVKYLPADSFGADGKFSRIPSAEEFKTAHARALYEKKYVAAASPNSAAPQPPVPPAMPSSGASAQPAEKDLTKMSTAELKQHWIQQSGH